MKRKSTAYKLTPEDIKKSNEYYKHSVQLIYNGYHPDVETKIFKSLRLSPGASGYNFQNKQRDLIFRFMNAAKKKAFLRRIKQHPVFKELRMRTRTYRQGFV